MNDTFSMSGVDIAGLVERLRDWHENWSLGSKGPAILTRAADALLAQAARAESAERQRDEALEALKAARGLLDLYREAVRIDVKMEGPLYMGANSSALKRAWEADRASLASDATPAPTSGVDLVTAITHAENELSQHIETYHDYEDDTSGRVSLRNIQHHLTGSLITDGGEFLTPTETVAQRKERAEPDEGRQDAGSTPVGFAKPASEPAGGDVQVAIAAGLKNLREYDQPGQSLDTRVARAIRAAIAALSSSTGPAEAVGWRRMNKQGTQSTGITDNTYSAEQWRREGDDVRPVYAYPAPATVEIWQGIATAPTDYTHVIGTDAKGTVSRTWFFAPSSITREWLKVPGGGKWKPLYWMPLREPAALAPATEGRKS